jgi:branched-chain amino acid transport system permease protein
MIALRENEPLATSVGVDVTRYLVLAAVVSAAMAARGRALRALRAHRRPGRVPLHLHRDHGDHGGDRRQGHARRPVVGGLIFGLLPEGLRALAVKPETQWIVYGVLMVLVVYFLPQGIVPRCRQLVWIKMSDL